MANGKGVSSKAAPKLLYFVTEDWYFCSHRLSLAIAAKNAGYDVYVFTRVSEHEKIIQAAGLKLIPSTLQRRSLSPARELREIWRIFKTLKNVQPDVLHNVAMKPVIYGSFAALFVPRVKTVNALAGLGYIYTSKQLKSRALHPVITLCFRFLLSRKNSRLVLQNPDDVQLFINKVNIARTKIRLIRGSGVSLSQFTPEEEPSTGVTVILAARMLWDKGVGEFVAAARRLKLSNRNTRFVLVGETDPENPAAITDEQLDKWETEDAVEWWGRRENMSTVFSSANIVCLPSYREGLPKVLLEAAACSRAIVTTDTPGCREIVRDGYNGLLVPPRNVDKLEKALRRLIEDEELRRSMGKQGRAIVEDEFSIERVVTETLAVYQDLLA